MGGEVEPGLGGAGEGVVAAVGDEAVGGVAAAGELLGERLGVVGGAKMLLFGAEVAEADFGGDGGEVGLGGDEVDGAAEGVGAVEGGAGAVEDVDAGDGFERDGDVEVEVTRLGVVDAETVEQDEGLLEGGAADGEVGLDAVAAAGLEIEGGVQTEEVGGVVEEEWLGGGVEDGNGAVVFVEGEGFYGGGDGDVLLDGGGLRGGGLLVRCLGEDAGGAEAERGDVLFHGWAVSIIAGFWWGRELIFGCYK